MKHIRFVFLKPLLSFIFFLLLTCSVTNAQKLPDVQKKDAHVPNFVKIDGSITEWDHNLLTYNHATEIFYYLANDDEYLYLLVRATKPEIINKILLGGITLVIDPTKTKSDKGVAITFPTYYKNERPAINLKNLPKANKDTLVYRIQTDSFRRASNQALTNKSKLIEVERVKGIPDSLISVYNDQQIRAAAIFDDKLTYNSELRVPIKYLNLNRSGSFSYHIKLNGATANNAHIQLSRNGQMLLVTGSNGTYAVPANSQYSSYVYATDFWGEYTLTN